MGYLKYHFDMRDLGEVNYIIGIKLLCDWKNKVLAIVPSLLVASFGMKNSKRGFPPFIYMEFIFLRDNHIKLLKRKNS